MIKRINNKGFVFVETIITSVILLTALLLLYNSYSKVIINEQKRLYYDDVVYVYKTLAIRDVLKKTINIDDFNNSVAKNQDCNSITGVGSDRCKFIYFFNIGSPIYNDSTDIENVYDFLKFYQLVYIKIKDISNIKKCINSNSFSGTDKKKCDNTINNVNGYAYTNFLDYLKSLDVDTDTDTSSSYQGHDGILISVFFVHKDGSKITESTTEVAFGKYEECIQNKVYDFYKENYYGKNSSYNLSTSEKTEAMNLYNKNKDLSFSIQCSYAYYYSWVYL